MGEARAVVVVLVAPDSADPPGLDPLRGQAEVRLVREEPVLLDAIEDADVLVVYDFRTTLVPAAVRRAPRLRWVHAASAGVDAVLVPEVTGRGLTVTNSRGVFDGAIAEYVLGVILVFAKDLHTSWRLQQERLWRHRESQMLRGQQLLIVGPGSIGRAIARLARAAGMDVRGVGRSERRDDRDFGRVAPLEELRAEIAGADFVALAMPLNEESRGMIGVAELAAFKPGARLINIARGGVVDEPALIEALRSGRLAGAALDVFAEEPLADDHPFWMMEHVLVSPHMSGDFEGWVEALGARFIENFERWQRGEELRDVVEGAALVPFGRSAADEAETRPR